MSPMRALRGKEATMGDEACACGHAPEEHGHDPKHPGSTACTECGCIAYECCEDHDESGRACPARD
jgi:hypothetical protein